ncbi:hypothetical protein PIB30_082730 [Stylosanthes scabra]|uniref:RNase H type-1 domain-containing protein n=1 Tax=Stylosanthes scabra TaxID=79078 RepID=A0ABU6UUE5_9FABA|nr:hypothetical protein [Stylosanthes scabra]
MSSDEIQKYKVGGYVTLEEREIKCWFGEVIRVKEQGEKYIEGLEIGLQFMLEELNAIKDEITIVVDRKDIVRWLNNEKHTNWQLRFVRNKVMNVAKLFSGINVIFRQVNKFRTRRQWETRSQDTDECWRHWEF